MDFRGNPINNYSNFSEFCKEVRALKEGFSLCAEANARAGFEAALIDKPYFFKCPAGLTDVAIPIIVNNNYLGAVFMGQVRTENDDLLYMEHLKGDTSFFKNNLKIIDIFKRIETTEFKKIQSVANLVDIIVKQLIDKTSLNSVTDELEYTRVRLLKEREKRINLEEALRINELRTLQFEHNPRFFYSSLNSAARLALMEGADKTQEMILLISDMFEYTIRGDNDMIFLRDEINNITTYLKIQNIRFGNKIRLNIQLEENIDETKIPRRVLIKIVDFLVMKDLYPKIQKGVLGINCSFLGNSLRIKVESDGAGISNDELFLILNGMYNCDDYISLGLYNVNKILVSFFGENHKMKIRSEVDSGTVVDIKIPMS